MGTEIVLWVFALWVFGELWVNIFEILNVVYIANLKQVMSEWGLTSD